MALVLTYLRLHVPQAVVARLFGTSQAAVSRELGELLPALRPCLPCLAVWELVAEGQMVPAASALTLAQAAGGRVLLDTTEQRVARSQDDATQRCHYSGKKEAHTLKTQLVTDADHHILAISTAVPGTIHDKPLCDALQTLDRLPDAVAGAERPRLTATTPHKKPKGGALSEEQRRFNRALGAARVRVEHCLDWLKNWAVLATRSRCAHDCYTPILCVLCGLVNAQTARWQAANAAYCE